MKLFTSAFIVLASFIVIFAGTAFAQEGVTTVRGNIYNMEQGGQGINGLNVSVNCNGNVQTATTSNNGLYVVTFPQSQCGMFNQVSSTVTFNSQTQSYSVFVSHNYRATLDFYFGATSVPEFGAIGGIVAAVGSGLAYFGMKRKYSL